MFTLPLRSSCCERFAAIRPHDRAYLRSPSSCTCSSRGASLWTLPLLALLWVNLHGIEYPVMLLIAGAYLGEWIPARLGLLPAVTPPPLAGMAAVGLALLAPLATPHGVALLFAPFTSLAFASQYVDELKPVDLGQLFALRMNGFAGRPADLADAGSARGRWAALASLRRDRCAPRRSRSSRAGSSC